MDSERDFKELWSENHVARYAAEADTLYLYLDGMAAVDEVETEDGGNHIEVKRDAATGAVVGFGIPQFSTVVELVGGTLG